MISAKAEKQKRTSFPRKIFFFLFFKKPTTKLALVIAQFSLMIFKGFFRVIKPHEIIIKNLIYPSSCILLIFILAK